MNTASSARAALRAAVAVAALALGPAATANAAAPANDAFAAAQALTAPANVPGTTVDATLEPGENYELKSVYGENSVWYSFTAPRTSRYRVADCGAPEDREIFVYAGSSIGDLRLVPDGSGSQFEPPLDCGAGDEHGIWLLFDATAGTTYHVVVVDKYQGYAGPFQLTLDDAPVPVYDSAIREVASRASVKRGRTVTYTATLRNTGTLPIQQEWVELIASKPNHLAKPALKIQYVSVKSTRGSCHRQRFFTKHRGALCAVGRLEPGQSAVVTAKVKLRQAISHWAFLDYAEGRGQPTLDDHPGNDESKVRTRIKR